MVDLMPSARVMAAQNEKMHIAGARNKLYICLFVQNKEVKWMDF